MLSFFFFQITYDDKASGSGRIARSDERMVGINKEKRTKLANKGGNTRIGNPFCPESQSPDRCYITKSTRNNEKPSAARNANVCPGYCVPCGTTAPVAFDPSNQCVEHVVNFHNWGHTPRNCLLYAFGGAQPTI
jgi:hypothetical protein